MGQPILRNIWLEGMSNTEWSTFEKMVDYFRKEIVATKADKLFSRFWKRNSNGFTQRAFNVILCGGVHSVVVYELENKVVYTKWYGWTPSYFADFPQDTTDLALKAVWERDLPQLKKLQAAGYRIDGGYNSMSLMKAIWEDYLEIAEYLVAHTVVEGRDLAIVKALASVRGNSDMILLLDSIV